MQTKHLIPIIICIVTGTGIYFGLKDLIQSKREKNNWSAEDRTILVKKCIEESGTNALQYPKSTQTYCECAHDKLVAQLSKKEYLKILKKNKNEIIDTITPLVQDCLNNYNKDMLKEMGAIETKPVRTWEQINQAFTEKHHTTINIEDIQRALDLLVKEKIMDTAIAINDMALPGFCYLSPSVMLDSYSKDSKLMNQPDRNKILTAEDEVVMLDQYQLRKRKDFKWQWVMKKIDTLEAFPQYQLSIPVFSLDKTRFIIKIEKHTSSDCMESGIVYLFFTDKQKTKHIILEKVELCE